MVIYIYQLVSQIAHELSSILAKLNSKMFKGWLEGREELFWPLGECFPEALVSYENYELSYWESSLLKWAQSVTASWGMIMKKGLADLNLRGILFLDSFANYSLSITNTILKYKDIHRWALHQDTLGHRLMIDFVVVSPNLQLDVLYSGEQHDTR